MEKENMTSPGISDIKDFDALLNMVRLDANLVDDLTVDQVTELRKRLNPYGRTIQGKGKFTCMSITNLSEQYMRKFLMTSLIGFLYRQCDEHELDDGEPTCPMDDFKSFTTRYNGALDDAKVSRKWLQKFNEQKLSEEKLTFEQKANRLTHTKAVSRGEGFKRRLVVRQFLDGIFQFNPDKHVRSAYSDNPLDPERVKPAQVNTSTSSDKKTNTTTRANSKFVKHIPPADTFHRWKYYTDSNYEEIRTAVNDLYCDKPDLEFAINPYEQFSSQEDADRFVQKHKNEVIADVLTLNNSKWNLCGSFKENRNRVNFYNERTAVLEGIFKQMEQDKKLGADLMRKRVKRKKKQNVLEAGPDSKEFKDYKKNNTSGFESMGAEDMSLNKKNSKEGVTFSVHDECPYDAVQVDVFDMRSGGQTVKKSEFFTQAEDPKRLDSLKPVDQKQLQ